MFLQIGIDSLFFGSCLHLYALFDLLGKSFDGDKPKFVRRHQVLLDLADELKHAIKPVVFTVYFINSLILCIVGFQFLMIDDLAVRFIALCMGCSYLIQTWIYSLGGQLVKDKSSSVAENFYQLDKDHVVIIARAQKPAVIKAWMYNAEVTTFCQVLNTTASFMTVLKSLIK